MNNTPHQPYTYFIGWSKQRKFYYGVRYAINCHPEDLWVKYFTSSVAVQEMRIKYGEPDIIQIRKKFSTKEQAINWEVKVLKRMKVVLREDFLNKNDVQAPPINDRIMSDDTKQKIREKISGTIRSDETKNKIREARKKQDMSWRLNFKHTPETIQKIKDARAKQVITDETKIKMSLAQSGEKHSQYGKSRSDETKNKIKEKLTGKKQSLETKNKISSALSNKKKKVIECPFCKKVGGEPQMKRWHFDLCKFKAEMI
jgi:hypothetical protein